MTLPSWTFIRETFATGGYPAPEQLVHVRSDA
jgi:hypothetical protein